MANEVAAVTCRDIEIKDDGGLQFTRFGQVIEFAGYLERGQMLPKGMTKEQAAIAIIFGAKMGIDVLASVQNIAVINGRPSVWGDAIGAIVQGSGLLEDEWEEEVGEGEGYKVRFHVRRKNRTHEKVGEFGYADAKRAGLWGKPGPWTQYPKRMMLLRARAFAYRDAFPDVLKGIRVVEEEQDAPIDVTVSAPPYAEQLPPPENGAPADGGAHALPKKTSASDIMRKAAAQKGGAAQKPAEEKPAAQKPAVEKPAGSAPGDGGDNPVSVFEKGEREKVRVPARSGELDLGK